MKLFEKKKLKYVRLGVYFILEVYQKNYYNFYWLIEFLLTGYYLDLVLKCVRNFNMQGKHFLELSFLVI